VKQYKVVVKEYGHLISETKVCSKYAAKKLKNTIAAKHPDWVVTIEVIV
jgi:hypothetical protein